MGVIAKYKFDQTIYENFIPEFNSGFTYTITDEIDTDGYTIRTIGNDSGALPTLMSFGAYSGNTKREQSLIDVYQVNTTEITSMEYMFGNCPNLKSINFLNANTEKVTTMYGLFAYCSKLETIENINFNTEKVKSMTLMFQGCSKLQKLNLSSFASTSLINTTYMFSSCTSLNSILFSSTFTCSNVTDMAYMFFGCSSLTSLNVSSFDTGITTNMNYMFSGCSSLTSLDVSNFNVEKVTNMSYMFRGCSSLTSLDISNFNTEKVANMSYMFNNCSSLTSLDLSNFNTRQVTNMTYMFAECFSLTSLDISNFDTSQVTNIIHMINSCYKLIDIGMIYCNSSTINKISDLIGTNTTIWYQDASLSDLTEKANITYKKYQTTTLSLNEPIQLRSVGDVHDEINYETGEYIQRIGEIVLDGSESWNISNNYDDVMFFVVDLPIVKDGINNQVGNKNNKVNDISWMDAFNGHNTGIFTRSTGTRGLGISVDKKLISSVQELKTWLQSNPITVQYQLAQPIITKIDTTILDQNNNYKSSQQTYDEQTYISVQSDTVVTPTSSVDYEIYTSTSTVTGTSATVENAEAGTPVSGVVYGETLLNCVQDKGNSEVVCLGDYNGTNITIEDSVEGNIKNAVIKGDTLVNLCPPSIYTASAWVGDTYKIFDDFSMLEKGKRYTFYSPIISKTDNAGDAAVVFIMSTDGTEKTLYSTWGNSHGTIYVNFTMGDKLYFNNFNVHGSLFKINYPNTIILEGDYTQEEIASIPYFEGMESVTNPSVTVHGKNLAINKPNTTQKYGGVVFTTDGNKFTMTGKNTGYFGYDFASQEVSSQLQAYGLLQTTIDFYRGKVLVNEPGTYTISSLFKTTHPDTSGLGGGSGLHISIKVHYDDTNTIDLSPSSANSTSYENGQKWLSKTFTVKKHINGIWLGLWYTGIDFSKFSVENIQLEKGSTATTYEQYRENTITCSEPISLHKIGDIQDELDLETGVLTQRIGEVVLDGSNDNIRYTTYGTNNEGYSVFQCTISIKRKFNGKWMSTFPQGSRQASDWKDKEYVGGNWYGSTNMSNTYVIKLLTSSMSSDDINGFKEYLQQNPITIQYELETKSIKTVGLSILDQDDKPTDNLHTFDTTTYINTYAQGGGLIPFVNIPKGISYDTILKANTQYTVKLNRTNIVEGTPLTVNLGGTELSIEDSADSFSITTPSTLTNNTLSIGGANNKVKDVMVIEGDYVDRDLDFFEGFVSVENPILTTTGKNLVFLDKNNPDALGSDSGNGTSAIRYDDKKQAFYTDTHRGMCSNVTFKPNTYYIISAEFLIRKTGSYSFNWQSPQQSMGTTFTSDTPFNETTWVRKSIKRLSYNNGKIGWIVYGGVWFRNLQIEEAESLTTYEPYKGNTLTTYPQVTLRSIGDIKDEWDVVGETVTRRIGEIVLDGSDDENWNLWATYPEESAIFRLSKENSLKLMKEFDGNCVFKCDKFSTVLRTSLINNGVAYPHAISFFGGDSDYIQLRVYKSLLKSIDVTGLREYLTNEPITVQYELAEPITESVRITPPNPQTSTANIQTKFQLSPNDCIAWNPYQDLYTHYTNPITPLNFLSTRQYVDIYKRRTYIDTNLSIVSNSKGISRYVTCERGYTYLVKWDYISTFESEEITVDLCGNIAKAKVSDRQVVIKVENKQSSLLSLSMEGLSGSLFNLMVVEVDEVVPELGFFEGAYYVGTPKDNTTVLDIKHTNGNLIDKEFEIYQNGNGLRAKGYVRVEPNREYVFRANKSMSIQQLDVDNNNVSNTVYGDNSTLHTDINAHQLFISASNTYSNGNGSTHIYHSIELCHKGIEKDYIRPRYYKNLQLDIKQPLLSIHKVFDTLYWDEYKGCYSIESKVGTKILTGAQTETWSLDTIVDTERTVKFYHQFSTLPIKVNGESLCDKLTCLSSESKDEEGYYIVSSSRILVRINKERLLNMTVEALRQYLAENNISILYERATPQVTYLTHLNEKTYLPIYRSEILTELIDAPNTNFSLMVPFDRTYRFVDNQESEGHLNLVTIQEERISDESLVEVLSIEGLGVANEIEEDTSSSLVLKPNYRGIGATHTLSNSYSSEVPITGLYPTQTVANINQTTKLYELSVKSRNANSSMTDVQTVNIPTALEVYSDTNKDSLEFTNNQWVLKGGQTYNPTYDTNGVFSTPIELCRGISQPGLLAEFKVTFVSGTATSRLYYTVDGVNESYSTVRGMSDGNEYYLGIFCTGGTKIDYATKLTANEEYTSLVPLSANIPTCFRITRLQSLQSAEVTITKNYIIPNLNTPIYLETYEGTTYLSSDLANLQFRVDSGNKFAVDTYQLTKYTLYWEHEAGSGNITATLGNATVTVPTTQNYLEIEAVATDDKVIVGGFNVKVKNLMLVRGAYRPDLKYFRGSRQVGDLEYGENGEKQYRITVVQGTELIDIDSLDQVEFKDDSKHRVVITKIKGKQMDKID